MKKHKTTIVVIALVVILAIIGIVTEEEMQEDAVVPEVATIVDDRDPIVALIEDRAEDKTFGVIINDIRINHNLGSSAKPDDKIVLIYLTWDVSNPPEMTRKMLEINSARIVSALDVRPEVSEVVVFWEVPYHLEGNNSAKFNYFKKNGEFYEGDKWYAPVLR